MCYQIQVQNRTEHMQFTARLFPQDGVTQVVACSPGIPLHCCEAHVRVWVVIYCELMKEETPVVNLKSLHLHTETFHKGG